MIWFTCIILVCSPVVGQPSWWFVTFQPIIAKLLTKLSHFFWKKIPHLVVYKIMHFSNFYWQLVLKDFMYCLLDPSGWWCRKLEDYKQWTDFSPLELQKLSRIKKIDMKQKVGLLYNWTCQSIRCLNSFGLIHKCLKIKWIERMI